MHPQQIQPHLNYTCCYTFQRNATLGTTLANAAQQSLGTCPPEVPNRTTMIMVMLVIIVIMGTMLISMMLIVTRGITNCETRR